MGHFRFRNVVHSLMASGLILSSLGCAMHTRSRAVVYVPVGPPRAVVEVRSPSPGFGYVWVPGYHRWDGGAYIWVGGRWERTRGRHWHQGSWHRDRQGWYWREGYWR